jgi:hypothetical protein
MTKSCEGDEKIENQVTEYPKLKKDFKKLTKSFEQF